MKSIIFLLTVILLWGCRDGMNGTPVNTAKDAVQRTFVITTSAIQDTIIAERFMSGNFVGIGRAVLFYDGDVAVGLVLIEDDRRAIIKPIEP